MYPPELRAAPLRPEPASPTDAGRYSFVPQISRFQMADEMAEAFLEQITLERDVERIKCELAQRVDFTSLQAWQLFNWRSSETMGQAEFTEMLFSFIGSRLYDRD